MATALKAALAITVLCVTSQALGQAYPSKPVRVLMPFAAGSGLDIATRHVAKALADALGQPFVVEYKQGGVGMVAMQELAKSPPDGHTLAYVNSAISVSQWLLGKGSFLLTRDVTSAGLISFTYNVLVVATNSPAHSIAAPAGTPPAIINRLYAALRGVLADPSTAKVWATLGAEIPDATLADAAELYRSETQRWEKFLQENTIKVD